MIKSNKKIFIVVISVIAIIIGLMAYHTIIKINSEKKTILMIEKLPNMPFKILQGEYVPSKNPEIIILFSPDCDHCERMAEHLAEHKASLANVKVLLISQASSGEVIKFAKQYKLNTIPELAIGIDINHEFHKYFGPAVVPSFYVYDKNKHLIKKIHGESNMNYIFSLVQ